MSRDDDLFFEDDSEGADDPWFPVDFLPEEISDDDIETLHDIQHLIGLPISGMIATQDDINKTGRAGQLRGVRFSSGAEALLWLYRRGIYLYSSLVQFPDGSWGVAIGSSENKKGSNDTEVAADDIPF